ACPCSIAPSATGSATALAFAKINLTLDVLRARDDGYHDVESLVVGVGLCDVVTAAVADRAGVSVSCADATLRGDANLAVRAARRLAEASEQTASLAISLTKGIPVGAGLGGGSSDAATTLAVCNRLWSLGWDRSALARVGAEIGSDVPVFFHLPAAVMTGRGEHVIGVSPAWSGWVVLVAVGVRVSTAAVYAAWRPRDGSAAELGALMSNHLEPAVFRVCPAVARAHEALTRLGVAPVRVSGAGSALYMLLDDYDGASEAAARVRREAIGRCVCVLRAPVGGALCGEDA
ncbi:MAG: 4-(cytidine 5'-diphospho)-2-C-methyl-D-erythritol kinase, partial [Phycisphaerae bacterium]